jgi:hypothetical protein
VNTYSMLFMWALISTLLESAKKRALEADKILMRKQKENEEWLQRAQKAEAKLEQM